MSKLLTNYVVTKQFENFFLRVKIPIFLSTCSTSLLFSFDMRSITEVALGMLLFRPWLIVACHNPARLLYDPLRILSA